MLQCRRERSHVAVHHTNVSPNALPLMTIYPLSLLVRRPYLVTHFLLPLLVDHLQPLHQLLFNDPLYTGLS
jgi:hypothetical protein